MLHMGPWWGCGPLGRCTLCPGAKGQCMLLGPSACLRPPAQTKAQSCAYSYALGSCQCPPAASHCCEILSATSRSSGNANFRCGPANMGAVALHTKTSNYQCLCLPMRAAFKPKVTMQR